MRAKDVNVVLQIHILLTLPPPTMPSESIQHALIHFLRENVLAEGIPINADTDLHTLGIDSVTIVELAMHIEERFGLEIPVSLLGPENTSTVRALAECAIRHGKSLR